MISLITDFSQDDYKDKCRLLTDRLKKLEAGESAAIAVEQRKYHDLQKTVAELKVSQKKHLSHQTSLVRMLYCFLQRHSDLPIHLIDENNRWFTQCLRYIRF